MQFVLVNVVVNCVVFVSFQSFLQHIYCEITFLCSIPLFVLLKWSPCLVVVYRTKCGIWISYLTPNHRTTNTKRRRWGQLLKWETVFPPAGRGGVTHMCFKYGAHIMYCEHICRAGKAVTKVRNSFFRRRAGRPWRTCVLSIEHT